MIAQKRFRPWKWLLLLAVLAGGFVGWRWYQSRSKETPLDYKTATVTRGDLTQVVTANGQINAVMTVAVGSQVSGIITGIKVDFNSRVTNGQVIAQIDPSTYQQNITQSEAELANAKAGLELAALNMRRGQALRTNDLISASEYDQAVVGLHQAEAVVKMRDALVKRAQVDLERTTIYAPIDGIVISRLVDVGQTVAASFNAPTLFTIANDLRNMRIEAMVSEADVGGVQEGQQVNFSVDAFPARQFRGEVTQVRYAPITNQNVVNYTAVVEVNNSDLKLRPGMTANASIVIAEKRNVLRAPNAALRFRPPEGAVVKGATNAPAGGTNKTAIASAGSDDVTRRGEGGERPNREEMRRRFENMTPEQREQMRARFGSRGAGVGSRGSEGPATHTVYVLEKNATSSKQASLSVMAALLPWLDSDKKDKPVLKPVTVKTGISDGTNTEVLEGLNEGDVVVTGLNLPAAATTARPPTGGSPFGGPFGGPPRPRGG
jgi:HlyD family secretion protein